MADGAAGPQIQWIIAIVMVKFVRFAFVTNLSPVVVERVVRRIRINVGEMSIVTNAVARTGAVIIYVKTLTKDFIVNVLQDINLLESHV